MALKKFLMAGFVAAVLVACGGSRNSETSPSSVTPQNVTLSEVEGSSEGETSVSSSSSVVGRTSCNENADENCMKDERDGQIYKTVKIGSQIWMAENLNYAYTAVPYKYIYKDSSYISDSTSWCYKDSAEYCAKYGRLYTWAAAMDSAGTWTTNGKGCGYTTECSLTYPVRGVCPEGWHLPTTAEFEKLFNAVGGELTVGKMLKSTSDWWSRYNGTDAFAFSALTAGHRNLHGRFNDEGFDASFWSSTENESNYAYKMELVFNSNEAYLLNDSKNNGFSVRCVKDGGRSSVTPQSSSSSCDVNTDEDCFKDERDGKTYRTVKIGDQVWMAENLNYAYTGIPYKLDDELDDDASDSTSWCYVNDSANCAKYGRLYTWAAAMDSVGAWSTNGKGCGYGATCSPTYPVRGVCTEGWHLPTQTEWKALLAAVRGQSAKMLKSTSGWNDDEGKSGNGTDVYFFSALPAGSRGSGGSFESEGIEANFWISTEKGSYSAHIMRLYHGGGSAQLWVGMKERGFSVRCVKDD